ncbi:MAG: glutamate-1-semialdehyde 2,1-aminomutase [Candidatus Omnitrophica bacterium]|nr:glutamate-1-semialdehyde 2,1-aminomutase [Candidatus Omnitrophota bacterium]
MATGLNSKLFQEAKKYLVGGVNSPVRSFRVVGGAPLFVNRGRGARIYTCEGRQYLDYCMSWGALILGHAHPQIRLVAKKAIDKGSSFGTASKQETILAKLICQAIPSIERVRLTNSGTEAVMSALRLARAYTGRRKIIRFKGAYHGHADSLLDCKGIPQDFTKHTLVCPYNDIENLESLVRKYKDDMAAVIVEPIAGNMGVVLPKDGFLAGLREITSRYKAILIFDEVITGFRLIYGGAQKLYAIKPDLTCLGKIIGGGFPCGAFGGKKDIMRLLAPEGFVYQAGTFSGNSVSVSAGITALTILSRGSYYQKLEKLTQYLCRGIARLAGEYKVALKINSAGSMFTLFFTGEKVVDYDSASSQDVKLFKRFYHGLLQRGVYLSPSGLEANFISIAHTLNDIDFTLDSIKEVFKKIGAK